MKSCELCVSAAKIYCESDQASLCWDCDAKVHCANFLVTKHSRTLLCHLCQSFTPWTATGPKLSPTVSVCQNCVNNSNCREERGNENDQSRDGDDHDDDFDKEDDTGDDEDDENGDGSDDDDDDDEEENQVVPWSSTAPPPASSSSNSDQECSTRMSCSDESASQSRIAFSLKRIRETTEHFSQARPLKDKERTMRDSYKGLQKPKVAEETMKFDICKLKKTSRKCQ